VIQERLSKLEGYLSELRDLESTTFQEYQINKFIRKFVERTLHTAIEACLDIGRRIIALANLRQPEDNKAVFTILAEADILPSVYLNNFQAMAGFRNVLVHEYAGLDDVAVFGVLKKHLGDFDIFIKAITAYLAQSI